MFMDGFMLNFLDSLFRKMLFGEISKRTVRIFGGVLIFPGFGDGGVGDDEVGGGEII